MAAPSLLNNYTTSSSALVNQLTLSSVAASTGNVIVVCVSGRTNSQNMNWTTPTWNSETFGIVSEYTGGDPANLEVFILKCTGSGTFNIVLNSDNFGYCNAHASVWSGTFDTSFFDNVQTAFVSTGTYSLPSISTSGVTADDVVINALMSTGWDASYNDVSATTYSTNGTQIALSETTYLGSRRMYTAYSTGTGSVTASYTKSSGSNPQYRMASFRLYQTASGPTIDSTPDDIRVTESRTIRVTAPTTAMTTGNTAVRIDDAGNDPITPSAVTNISGLTYDVVFTVPDEYAGLPYSATGYPIIVTTTDGSVTSSNVDFLPVTGNGYVTLTDVSDTDINSLPALEVDDQIEWTNAAVITIGADGKVSSTEESTTFEFRVWDHNDSTWGDWAEVVFGDVVDTAPTMPADTSVNVAENTTAVGTFAATAGTSPITYTLGGADSVLFGINSSTGAVVFLSAPDYEAGSNTKSITVTATNAFGGDSQNITVNITNVVEPPIMPSDATINVAVGATAVINTGADFVDGVVTYTKSGVNQALFSINSSTGALAFLSPAVIGTYTVIRTATNSAGADSQTLTVQVVAASAAPKGSKNSVIIGISI